MEMKVYKCTACGASLKYGKDKAGVGIGMRRPPRDNRGEAEG